MTRAATGQDDLGLAAERGASFGRSWRAVTRFARLQPGGTFAIIVLLAVVVAAIFAPYLKTIGDGERDVRRIAIAQGKQLDSTGYLQPPNSDWWFGTNSAGQDMWSRVIYGTRPTLIIGVGAVGIAMTVAIALALSMGFLKGFVDAFLLRILETGHRGVRPPVADPVHDGARAQPARHRGRGLVGVCAADDAGAARQRAAGSVDGVRRGGTGYWSVKRADHAPAHPAKPAALAIVNASIIIPAAIMAEAGLAFLGFGPPPPSPSWGVDIGPAARAYFYIAWWLPVFPGLALSLTVLAFNFLGDSLRDVLDPRLRGSGLV